MMLQATPDMTVQQMADSMNLGERQVRRILQGLRESGRLHREGSNKKGCWIVDLPEE